MTLNDDDDDHYLVLPATVDGYLLTEDTMRNVHMCFMTLELVGTDREVARRCAVELGIDMGLALAAVRACVATGWVSGEAAHVEPNPVTVMRNSAELLEQLADRAVEVPEDFVGRIWQEVRFMHADVYGSA